MSDANKVSTASELIEACLNRKHSTLFHNKGHINCVACQVEATPKLARMLQKAIEQRDKLWEALYYGEQGRVAEKYQAELDKIAQGDE